MQSWAGTLSQVAWQHPAVWLIELDDSSHTTGRRSAESAIVFWIAPSRRPGCRCCGSGCNVHVIGQRKFVLY